MTDNTQDKRAYLREQAAKAAASRSATSPQGIEATLSQVSDEMMQDAIERRDRAKATAITPD